MVKKADLNSNVKNEVGLRVRQLRKEAGMSQEVLAERCGIFRTYLSRVESGMANVSITVLASLATVCGVKVQALFDK